MKPINNVKNFKTNIGVEVMYSKVNHTIEQYTCARNMNIDVLKIMSLNDPTPYRLICVVIKFLR